jgi:uncharacterized protein YpiB (UPF0302 family)
MINEWYHDALRRKAEAVISAQNVINEAQERFRLKCEIDKALDEGDEEKFYQLSNELKGFDRE